MKVKVVKIQFFWVRENGQYASCYDFDSKYNKYVREIYKLHDRWPHQGADIEYAEPVSTNVALKAYKRNSFGRFYEEVIR